MQGQPGQLPATNVAEGRDPSRPWDFWFQMEDSLLSQAGCFLQEAVTTCPLESRTDEAGGFGPHPGHYLPTHCLTPPPRRVCTQAVGPHLGHGLEGWDQEPRAVQRLGQRPGPREGRHERGDEDKLASAWRPGWERRLPPAAQPWLSPPTPSLTLLLTSKWGPLPLARSLNGSGSSLLAP